MMLCSEDELEKKLDKKLEGNYLKSVHKLLVPIHFL